MLRSSFALALLLCLPGCSGDSKATSATPHIRRVVTSDWLNKSLSVLDYDKLVAGAPTRDDALIATIDLSAYEPGPLEVAVAPDSKTAVVTVGPGFFAGPLAQVFGIPNIATTGTALLVDLDTHAIVEAPPPAPPMGVVIAPDGTRALVADHGGSTVSVIDLGQRKLTGSVEVGSSPEEVSVAPDGKVAAVNTDSNDSIRFFDPKSPGTTLSAPLHIGADPDASTFVPSVHRVVIAQSLPRTNLPEVPGFTVIDVADPMAAKVLENQTLPGVPYGADVIPGTTRVLVTSGVSAETTTCALYEIDVATTPATRVRTIELPCTKLGFPMSTAIEPDGKYAFVGIINDDSLMVVDLTAGSARRIPWLASPGPTRVALAL